MLDDAPAGVTLANWDLGGAPSRWAYRHVGDLFEHAVITPASERTAPWPAAPAPEVGAFPVEPGVTLDRYVDTAPVDAVAVLHKGRVAYERRPRLDPGERHLLMSVTKLLPSLLIGLLDQRGLLDLATPVDAVVPELAVGGWRGVAVRDVLDMTSGIDCPELGDPGAYSDPAHPFHRFEATLGWRAWPTGRPPSTYDYVAALPWGRPPGECYEYTSVNTFVLSWLVERVTGRSFADVVEREVWIPGGFADTAHLCRSASGAPVSHGGLATTLHDLVRLGSLFTGTGPVVDPDHLDRIRSGVRGLRRDADPSSAAAITAYGPQLPPPSRQWNFVTADGDLYKGGFGGQGLYVSPARDVVVAFVGTPTGSGATNQLPWYVRRLVTGLF